MAMTIAVVLSPQLGAAETYLVRSAPDGPGERLAETLAERAVGEAFCTPNHCVVVTKDQAQRAALFGLATKGAVAVEHLEDALKIHFQKGTYDADRGTFDRSFSGDGEVDTTSAVGQYAVVFKSHPSREWLKGLEDAGLWPLEPISPMAYLVYGPRESLSTYVAAARHVHSAIDLPAGVRRFNLDPPATDAYSGAAPTSVHVVDVPDSEAMRFIQKATSGVMPIAYRTGRILTYSLTLTPGEATVASSFPEVVAIRRHAATPEPSDERSNRLVLGDWQAPASSWPRFPEDVFSSNCPPFQETWLSAFRGETPNPATGLDVAHQTIGILDTGVDAGLYESNTARCPQFLFDPQIGCRLLFTTDTTESHYDPADTSRRADDFWWHGTIVTSLAAGILTPNNAHRDYTGYALTEGTAPRVGVALSKIMRACGADRPWRQDFVQELPFANEDLLARLRYSLVVLTSDGVGSFPVPAAYRETDWPPALDPMGTRNPVTIMNHSWNLYTVDGSPEDFDYDETAIMMDRTARRLSYAAFNFSGNTTDVSRGTATRGALHVITSGNRRGDDALLEGVRSPGTAKNAITVGATQTYNPQECGNGDSRWDRTQQALALNPRLVSPTSRIGYSNGRLKPDLVAPGTRAYGWRSETTATNICNYPYNHGYTDLGPLNEQQHTCSLTPAVPRHYLWAAGTSHAAPIVSGAAALVREWLTHRSTAPISDPSPALLKAVLIGSAKNLVPWRESLGTCCENDGLNCWPCGDMRPTPDQQQGWGGVSVAKLFRAPNTYYLYDQETPAPITPATPQWTKVLRSPSGGAFGDVDIALVWTDRPGAAIQGADYNLNNDLDITVSATGSGGTRYWHGNYYYTDRDLYGPDRTGYSLATTDFASPSPDRKNNVERINIRSEDIPTGTTFLTVTVTGLLNGNGLDPEAEAGGTLQQDFALAVINAKE